LLVKCRQVNFRDKPKPNPTLAMRGIVCRMAKIGRNQPCPCGSGKKYKRCCGDPLKERPAARNGPLPPAIAKMLREQKAKELMRTQQQGLGKPIISTDFNDHKVVAVGNTVYFSKDWKFFTDFLSHYLKTKLDPEWGNEELAKAPEERHPIVQWYTAYCEFQKKHEKQPDGTYSGEATGVFFCYLGLAYSLYLLDHNAELQERYLQRLKRADQFQGAYYELMVANCLIRSGFDLALEDETDESTKHCEFSATSKRSGKKYWIEAKMRSVAGVLGKTKADGAPPTSKPTAQVTTHINKAFEKPADDERIIFVDVNTTPMKPEDFSSGVPTPPKWMDAVEKQLSDKERDLIDGERAYVFVTNMSFHLALDDTFRGQAAVPFGLGIPDYNKPGRYTFKEAWRNKQKHLDMLSIEKALTTYPQIPITFGGDLPPTKPGDPKRLQIGDTCEFNDENGKAVVGTIVSAAVSEHEKRVTCVVREDDEKLHIHSEPITDDELQIYRQHPETYFGAIQRVTKNIESPYELFEHFVATYSATPRERLLELAKDAPDLNVLSKLDHKELVLELCERWAVSAQKMQKPAAEPVPKKAD